MGHRGQHAGSKKRSIKNNEGEPNYADSKPFTVPHLASRGSTTTPHRVTLIMGGGNVSAITLDGVSLGRVTGNYPVAPGQAFAITYSTAPTIAMFVDASHRLHAFVGDNFIPRRVRRHGAPSAAQPLNPVRVSSPSTMGSSRKAWSGSAPTPPPPARAIAGRGRGCCPGGQARQCASEKARSDEW
jgi:hypothetical protein